MKSQRTKTCIKRRNFYIILSWLICFGTAVALFAYGFATKWTGGPKSELAEQAKSLMITAALAFLPMFILSLAVKDKIKPTVRMINLILAAYFVGNWFMYIVGAVMLIDTYIISALIEKYKMRIIANKELDARL